MGSRFGDDQRLTLDLESPTARHLACRWSPARPSCSAPSASTVASAVTSVWVRPSRGPSRACCPPAPTRPTACTGAPSPCPPTACTAGPAHPGRSWSSAVIGLTLVRTFAQGTWLQVLPLYDERRDEPDGTVADPAPISSRMQVPGAFPDRDRALWSRRELTVLDRVERLRQRRRRRAGCPTRSRCSSTSRRRPARPAGRSPRPPATCSSTSPSPGTAVPVRVEAPVGAEWLGVGAEPRSGTGRRGRPAPSVLSAATVPGWSAAGSPETSTCARVSIPAR